MVCAAWNKVLNVSHVLQIYNIHLPGSPPFLDSTAKPAHKGVFSVEYHSFWQELMHKDCKIHIVSMYLWMNRKTQVYINTHMLRPRNRGLVLCRTTTLLAWHLYEKVTAPTHTVATAPHQTTSTSRTSLIQCGYYWLFNVCGAEVFILIGSGATSMGGWLAPMLQGLSSPTFKGHFPYGTISQRNEFLKFTIVKA